MDNLKKPKIFGPGLWFSIHLMALNAVDSVSKINFRNFMLMVRDNLMCGECKKHCTDYILKNPIEPFFYYSGPEGENIGCFKWTWEFHNTVNSRLGKPVITLGEAKRIYTQDICSENCDGEDDGENREDDMRGKKSIPFVIGHR